MKMPKKLKRGKSEQENDRVKQYVKRIVDQIIAIGQKHLTVLILSDLRCGKTRTATERCRTMIEFQDEENRENYLKIAETSPKLVLKREKPILFDEWQDAPKIWGTIRKDCDDHPDAVGEYYLTGSTSKHVSMPHTGTGRITEITMYPMPLYETGESNGTVSLSGIFTDSAYDIDGAEE